MAFSYRPLWVTLASRELKKNDLIEMTGLSPCIMQRLKNKENITTATLDRICKALGCRIEEVLEYIPDPADSEEKG